MKGPILKLISILFLAVVFCLHGCAGGNYGKLSKTDQISEKELRQNWRDYSVYYLAGSALVYKINNDRKIMLSSKWVAVTEADIMAKSTIFDTTWVAAIFGQNDELYGYLVNDYDDRVNVKIIDETTLRLYYHHTRKGGP